ncbi:MULTISPECIES: DUF2970 domain-containing protein [Aquitalea]|uniref:DUF2970 domain-containing protein n=1 Tax=Aquitalea magnusonii TaxID=332411 RepID=A0A318J7K4_9NEIS|nr:MULTISPECIES: DUF2970 domain-containing protein [Aquitalea]PXX43591.1 hypothetical protein DFR38_11427 [Aquitalea magnusonii]
MSWWRGVLAVLAAFAGIRRQQAAQQDGHLRPLQLIATALLLVAALIGLLLLLVNWISH